MIHLDLFSGIGGFAYAADQVFDNVEHIFCDNDKFCQQVLNKHWPEAKIYGDIRQITTGTEFKGLQVRKAQDEAQLPGAKRINSFTADSSFRRQRKGKPEGYRQRQQEKAAGGQHRGIDLLTGGFPCQPFSAAGLRRGTADERHLWPEMLRVIRLTKPKWVIAENVRGLVTWNDGLVFEQVCTDLEAAGYEVQPLIIPAVAVNAPHRRDRVWFVAHSTKPDDRRNAGEFPQTDERQAKKRPQEWFAEPSGTNNLNATATSLGRGRGRNSNQFGSEQRQLRSEEQKGSSTRSESSRRSWSDNWHEVAAELCSVDDGLPVELDGFKLSKSAHRKEQLKAYGNAIVPQVAIEIMQGMFTNPPKTTYEEQV